MFLAALEKGIILRCLGWFSFILLDTILVFGRSMQVLVKIRGDGELPETHIFIHKLLDYRFGSMPAPEPLNLDNCLLHP